MNKQSLHLMQHKTVGTYTKIQKEDYKIKQILLNNGYSAYTTDTVNVKKNTMALICQTINHGHFSLTMAKIHTK